MAVHLHPRCQNGLYLFLLDQNSEERWSQRDFKEHLSAIFRHCYDDSSVTPCLLYVSNWECKASLMFLHKQEKHAIIAV